MNAETKFCGHLMQIKITTMTTLPCNLQTYHQVQITGSLFKVKRKKTQEITFSFKRAYQRYRTNKNVRGEPPKIS